MNSSISGGTGKIPREAGCRIGADRDGNFELPSPVLRERAAVVLGAMLLRLPMHSGGARIEHLHAVTAHVALARFRILGDDHRPRDISAAVLGPALQDGKIEQRKTIRPDHILAFAVAHGLGKNGAKLGEFRKHFDLVENALRRLHVQNRRNSPRDLVQRIHLERQIHAPLGANQVRHRSKPRAFCALEQQRRAAPLDRAVRNLGDFQHRIDLGRNALELAFLFQLAQKISQIAIRHFPSLEIRVAHSNTACLRRPVGDDYKRRSSGRSRETSWVHHASLLLRGRSAGVKRQNLDRRPPDRDRQLPKVEVHVAKRIVSTA